MLLRDEIPEQWHALTTLLRMQPAGVENPEIFGKIY